MNGVVAVRALRWRKAAEAGPATAIDLVAGCMVGWCSGALPHSALWEMDGQAMQSGGTGGGTRGRNDGSQGQGLFPERPGRNLPLIPTGYGWGGG